MGTSTRADAYAEDRRTTAATHHTEIDKEQPKANPVGEHTVAKILWQTSQMPKPWLLSQQDDPDEPEQDPR